MQGMELYLKDVIAGKAVSVPQEKVHHIIQAAPSAGGQAIYLDHGQNVLLGTSDRRKGGCASGY